MHFRPLHMADVSDRFGALAVSSSRKQPYAAIYMRLNVAARGRAFVCCISHCLEVDVVTTFCGVIKIVLFLVNVIYS